MAGKYFWIKERHNPQLGKYYSLCGNLTVKEARSYEDDCIYGYNIMHKFETRELYYAEADRLRESGEKVQGRR